MAVARSPLVPFTINSHPPGAAVILTSITVDQGGLFLGFIEMEFTSVRFLS